MYLRARGSKFHRVMGMTLVIKEGLVKNIRRLEVFAAADPSATVNRRQLKPNSRKWFIKIKSLVVVCSG